MKGPHLLPQPASPLLEGWMRYERKDDTWRNGRRMLLPRAGLLLTNTHSSFLPPSATWPHRHQTSSFTKGTLPRHRSQASVTPRMDAPLCRQGACRNPAEMFHMLVVAASCGGWLTGHPAGTPCPTALEQEVGVSNSSDLTQCHNIPQCSRLGQDLMPPLAQGHFFLLLNIQSKLKVEKHQA